MRAATPYVTAGVFDGFGTFLERYGVSLDDVLRSERLSADALKPTEHYELPLQVVTTVLECAARLTKRPCLGLDWAEEFPVGGSGTFGYLVANARTLEEAVRVIARYVSLVVHPVRCDLTIDDREAALTWFMPPSIQKRSTQYVLFAVGVSVVRLRAIAGPDWNPLSVDLPCAESCCTTEEYALLGPNVRFEAAHPRVAIGRECLSRRSHHSDPRLFELIRDLGDRKLKERGASTDLALTIRRAIAGRLSTGDVTLESIAQALDLSPRTLQSRLAAESTSFEDILQLTRRELAETYLRDTNMPLTEIALELGFSELSSFTRASLRWFSAPPSTIRQQLKTAAFSDRTRS